MFTGIVERVAPLADLRETGGGRRLTLVFEGKSNSDPWRPVALGESIALNGVCLTVSSFDDRRVSFDAVEETLEKSTLGGLRAGDPVNVERALRVGDSLGGHYVTGHIDGTGKVAAREPGGDQVLFKVTAPDALLCQMIPKGSIAVDGISLTLVDVERDGGWFSFAVIPHTLQQTTLGRTTTGTVVNLETDALGKWVLRAVSNLADKEEKSADRGLKSLLEQSGYGETGSSPGADGRL